MSRLKAKRILDALREESSIPRKQLNSEERKAATDLAKAGDIKGLRAFEINPVSSSPKAIARYRDLCIIAIEAQAAR